MIIEIKVPSVGESITEVTLAKIISPEGSVVQLDQVLCEFESDKTNFELSAEAAGKIHYIAQEGDDLPIGALVCTIDTDAAAATAQVVAKDTVPPPLSPATNNSDNEGPSSKVCNRACLARRRQTDCRKRHRPRLDKRHKA